MKIGKSYLRVHRFCRVSKKIKRLLSPLLRTFFSLNLPFASANFMNPTTFRSDSNVPRTRKSRKLILSKTVRRSRNTRLDTIYTRRRYFILRLVKSHISCRANDEFPASIIYRYSSATKQNTFLHHCPPTGAQINFRHVHSRESETMYIYFQRDYQSR